MHRHTPAWLLVALAAAGGCGQAVGPASDGLGAEAPVWPDLAPRDSGGDSSGDFNPSVDKGPFKAVTLVVAGDIAQVGLTERARANAAVIKAHHPTVEHALLVGDIARYSPGTITLLEFFNTYYKPSQQADWGQFDPIAFPVPGNHEYAEQDARGYFDYFAPRFADIKKLPSYHGFADTVGKGWYSFDVNGWHVISLNSNCSAVGGCVAGGPQESWLKADLAQHPNMPLVAFWHHPRWVCPTGGVTGVSQMQAFWADLYDAKADLVFVGHTHFYQRWKPLDKASPAALDAGGGITEIVVGNSGVSSDSGCTDSSGKPADPRIAAQQGGDAGVGTFYLTLGSDGRYTYEYWLISKPTGPAVDSGSGTSHHLL